MFTIEATKKLVINKFPSHNPYVFVLRKLFQEGTRTTEKKVVRPVFHNALKYQNSTALYDRTGNYTFSNIYATANELSGSISKQLNGRTGERVLFLCPNDASYVIAIWAIWMSGQIAVPLSPLHPDTLLQYYMNDTNSNLIVASPEYGEKMGELSRKSQTRLYVLDEDLLTTSKNKNCIDDSMLHNAVPLDFYQSNDAMILYTSGTTGNPKGVVLTHRNISVQVKILTEAWKWSHNDVILHTLPLHHVHGLVVALFCPLFMGAITVMMPKFNADEAWSYLLNKNEAVKEKVTVFMAVPTLYSKLIEEYEAQGFNSESVKIYLTSNVRLMVSGSAPLPTPLYDKWLDISGHKLLERYGMTEIGMCLSNLYDSEREPGYVGLPLPSVSVALADQENGNILIKCTNANGKITTNDFTESNEDINGELLVKGDSIFKEYYNKPKETESEFTNDGWFKTGDISQYVRNKKKIRMLGRKSADIIKSGGYKISALQIEALLLTHPGIKECAVLGVNDNIYGERVAAVVVPNKYFEIINLDNLKPWAIEKMPKYWIPTVLRLVDEIPKNAMGKVNKRELKKHYFGK